MFDPKPLYDISTKQIPIRDFYDYREEFVTRPPYQRKSVWSRAKRQNLLDSLFRRFYVPRIVLREVRLSDNETRLEVIDGQQRITAVQEFLRGDMTLPRSLKTLDGSLPGKRFADLPPELRRFVNRDLVYAADIIKRIADPMDAEHQRVATEIFSRLQQGESLNTMEVAHARLSSTVRNFLVKYADDQQFDFEAYRPVEENSDKLPFFRMINRNNDRMQHLALLARFLLIERADGPTDIRDTTIVELIDGHQTEDGIGDESFEEDTAAKSVLGNLRALYDLFSDDPMIKGGGKVRELSVEYFIISVYMLLRHLRRWYMYGSSENILLRDFLLALHARWKRHAESDTDILLFSDNRQQSGPELAARDRILRQAFFEFADQRHYEMLTKDQRRVFSEAQRIEIYRRDEGRCQECLSEGKSEEECVVAWPDYEADHVLPHTQGGWTVIDNGQVLCVVHNRRKGATTPITSRERQGTQETN